MDKLLELVDRADNYRGGWRHVISPYGLQAIFELMQINFTIEIFNEDVKNFEIRVSMALLNILNRYVEETDDKNLLDLFTNCLFLMRKKWNVNVNSRLLA